MLLSSNPFRLVSAITSGFQVIPIIPFESLHQNDFQITLIENHILRLRNLRQFAKKLRNDAKILMNGY